VHANPKRQRGCFPFRREDLRQTSLALRVRVESGPSVRAETPSITRFWDDADFTPEAADSMRRLLLVSVPFDVAFVL
jgi:hypothetical protein